MTARLRALGRDLSVSARLVGASPALLDSLAQDRAALGVQAVPRWSDEPYRRKLGLMTERLQRMESGARCQLRPPGTPVLSAFDS